MPASLSISDPVLDRIDDPLLSAHNIELDLLRLDRIHPTVHGNKWFKLKYNLDAAIDGDYQQILTFGGAYSNHLYAVAAATRLLKLTSIGLVRGELVDPLNPVLQFAQDHGMTLIPISRGEYRNKQEAGFITGLEDRFGRFYLIPEGGSNELGVRGCQEIVSLISKHNDQSASEQRMIAMACGTGATLAGLIRGISNAQLPWQALGVSVLKGGGFLEHEVERWLGKSGIKTSWRIAQDYHFGGYAKSSAELDGFISRFVEQTGISIEPVYTGKLLYALYDLVRRGRIAAGTRITAIHTGGVNLIKK